METALTAPNWSHDPNNFTTDHALILFLCQLLNQTTYINIHTNSVEDDVKKLVIKRDTEILSDFVHY